jgi:3-methyladenine DNA glycosylase AlkD
MEKTNQIISSVREELIRNSDEKTKKSGEGFFKEPVKLYGVKSSVVHKISSENFRKLLDKDKATVFGLCELFWKSGMMEESFIACNWSYSVRKQFVPSDFDVFREWIEKYVTNWASCDTFCNHTVGEFVEMYPGYIEKLKKWTSSENRWMKRASSVSLIIPARKGLFLKEIFQIAENLISDKDDMVQKGYGWMLKAASQAHQKEVIDYVMTKKTTMPRTAFRYAIEKMPPELRTKAMEK